MSKLIARWADFSKGDAGWVDKSRVQDGYFLGENVVPYRDGSIGPRSGLLDLGATSIPAGTVYDMGYVDLATGGIEYVWLRKGTVLARLPVFSNTGFVLTGQAFAATTGAFTTANIGDAVEYDPRITLFSVYTDKCYKCDWSAGANGTLTAIAGSPGGVCLEIFGDFLVVANITNHHNRLQFSAASDYTTWPAGNFIDLSAVGNVGGGAPSINAMRRVKDQLLVWMDTGQLFVITGVLGENEVIREFMPGDHDSGPAYAQTPVRGRDGSVWWTRRQELPNVNDQVYNGPSAMPISYLGGARTEVPAMAGYLRQAQRQSNRSSQTIGVPGDGDKAVVLLDTLFRGLLLRDGAWSRHVFPGTGVKAIGGPRGDLYMMGSAGTAVAAWQFDLERPPWFFSGSGVEALPYATGDLGGPAGASVAWLATPEFRTPDQSLITVERIDVTFTAHCTRDSVNNHLDVLLQQYDVAAAAEVIKPAQRPPDFDSIAGAMSAGGVTIGMEAAFDLAPDASYDYRRRVAFYPKGGQPKPAPAVRVALRNLLGVSIHEIIVFGELTPQTLP